jgi:hypothetical protein
LCRCDKRNSFYPRGAGPAGPSRFVFTAETLAPRSSAVRGEILSNYLTHEAWGRVAKMLFPDVELVKTFLRDRWLIKRYGPPNETSPPEIILKNQPASLLPGGITYISGMVSQGRTGFAPVHQSGKIFPPKKLIAKVDRAYFRRSLREKVSLWFTRRGFDLKQRTISKKDFEAAVAAHPAGKPRPVETPISEAINSLWPQGIPRHVRADARDAKIKQYLVDNKYDVPNSDGALRRAVQRALKG